MILLICCSNRGGENSNSYIALKAAQKSMVGIESEIIDLKDNRDCLEKIKQADGIIFGMPVYFGHYPSLLKELLDRKFDLYPKVVGFISVGAKRNGGEETTVLTAAWDIMRKGAIVVNDGAPESQFGGLCVAGDRTDVLKDEKGLKNCYSLGKRIVETALILKAGNLKEKVILKTLDTERILKRHDIKRCLACDQCPNPRRKEDYGCVINDDMRLLHNLILEADGLRAKGFGQRFIERTRYLRRDNYRLTYTVIKIKDIRHIPIFLKENSILCRKHFKNYAKIIKSGREKVQTDTPIYQPIGYKDIQCG